MPDHVRVRNCVPTQHELRGLQVLLRGDGAGVEVQPETMMVQESVIDFTLWKEKEMEIG